MALGDNDAILYSGVNRGIGNSGVTSRAIQQNDIEANKSLRGALAESQATMQNEAEQRQSQAQASFMKNQTDFMHTMHTNGLPGQGGTIPAQITKSLGKYLLNIPGASSSPAFSSFGELQKYLEDNGLKDQVQLLTSGLGDMQNNHQDLLDYQSIGGRFTSDQHLESLGFLVANKPIGTGMSGNFPSFGNNPTPTQPNQNPLRLSSVQRVVGGDTDPNVKAHAVASAIDQIALIASPKSKEYDPGNAYLLAAMRHAQETGKAEDLMLRLAKNGTVK